MKEYLPFIILMILAFFRFYSNFQKEQRKAQRRNPSVPGAEKTNEQSERPSAPPQPRGPVILPGKPVTEWRQPPGPLVPKEDKPQPILVKESDNPRDLYEPVYKREYKEPVYKPEIPSKPVIEKRATPHRVELTHLEDMSDETRINRAIHQPHHHKFGITPHGEEETGYEFDVHDAVIKEAILNRPQY